VTFAGELIGIYLAPHRAAELRAVEEARADPGHGLEGDRFFVPEGTGQRRSPDSELTLIEIESIEALARDYKIELEPGRARRSFLTRGVPLNHLVGQEFLVGQVRLRGIRLCEPCDHLESLTVSGVKNALRHRGGLRAQILSGGPVRRGNSIRPA
jgi:MOSC domain-containing protein YiiM